MGNLFEADSERIGDRMKKVSYYVEYGAEPKYCIDVKGSIPAKFRFPLVNADSAELLCFEDGSEVLLQRLDSHPFVIDLYHIHNSRSLQFKVRVVKDRLCLFFMLDGIVDLYSSCGRRISHFRSKRFHLNHISKGEYQINNIANENIVLIVAIKPNWTKRFFQKFRHLYNLLYGETAVLTNKVLPQCFMDSRIIEYLEEVYNYSNANPGALNGTLRTYVSLILERYEKLIIDKISSIAYRAKHFIEINYKDPDLNIEKLASDLATTAKTLIKHFKYEFGITPYAYLIETRL